MYDKRVEILFDEKEYKALEQEARRRKQSVGAVVREAVGKYVTSPARADRLKAVELMAQLNGPVGTPEEIKADIIRSITEGIEKSLETD